MPVYEYECDSCGGRFEAVQKFSDPALSECALCKAANVRKVLSTPAFVLKGSGWYVTDYPSDDRKKANESEKPKEKSTSAAGCSPGACGGACASKAGS
ncbi:MAG TPA: zinc ribbon domain-containing protein [Nitrospirota bacterium]